MTELLIVGASTRAAAHSALRAGLRPFCADQFADQDLRATARVLSIAKSPHDFPRLAEETPPGPWMYTGALENHPDVIAEIAAHRLLWGNSAEVVTAVRDAEAVSAVLSSAGLAALEVRPESNPPAPDGRWMLKPQRGASGRGVTPWTRRARRSRTLHEPHYFQQRAAGTPLSALFLGASSSTGQIGVTQQLVGEPWLAASPFRYCGSLGPIQLAEDLQETIRRTGEVLAERFQLRGLFGIDFLCDGTTPRLTEVNPRYTASVEVLEHAYGIPLLDWHRRAFTAAETGSPILRASQIAGKAILYAHRSITVPPLAEFSDAVSLHRLPCVADRPLPGTRIRTGEPICTILAAGQTEQQCWSRLKTEVRVLRSKLFGPSP